MKIDVSHLFVSKWGGFCSQCPESFQAGEQIGYIFDELSCAFCVDEAQQHNYILSLEEGDLDEEANNE